MDDCNTCTCTEGIIACTLMECNGIITPSTAKTTTTTNDESGIDKVGVSEIFGNLEKLTITRFFTI